MNEVTIYPPYHQPCKEQMVSVVGKSNWYCWKCGKEYRISIKEVTKSDDNKSS